MRFIDVRVQQVVLLGWLVISFCPMQTQMLGPKKRKPETLKPAILIPHGAQGMGNAGKRV